MTQAKESMFIDESNEAYHARDGVSASRLKSMAKGWRWYEAEHITKVIERKESPAMRMGTAIHAAILEPEAFDRQYVVCPPEFSDRRTKAHKEWAAAVPDGSIILSAAEDRVIESCRDAVMSNPAACAIIGSIEHAEKSFVFDDLEAGAHCRVRFDLIAGRIVGDIKTIDSLDDGAVEKAIQSFRYDLQVAHYLEGFACLGFEGMEFVFIFVETSPPHRCRVVKLSPSDLEAARDQRVSLLREYARRSESGDWSDPGEGELQTVFLSDWFNRKVMASL